MAATGQPTNIKKESILFTTMKIFLLYLSEQREDFTLITTRKDMNLNGMKPDKGFIKFSPGYQNCIHLVGRD